MGQAKDGVDTMKEMMAELKMEMIAEIKMEMMAEMKKEMMAEMNERLSLAEGKLAKTEDQLAATKDDFAVTKDELAAAKDDLAATKDAMAKAMTEQAEALTCFVTKDDLESTKDALMSKTDVLEREVAILTAPPFIHACGSRSNWLHGNYMAIPYTSLLYSSTNTEGGGLDITTGVFTAPHGGSYTVYWDTSSVLKSGEYVQIYLQKNGETIHESLHYSQYNGPSGYVYDQGGRTIVVYLGLYDTLQLYRAGGSGEIDHTTFCVSLTTPDI